MRTLISYLCTLSLLTSTLPARAIEMNAPPAPTKVNLELVDHYFMSAKTVGEVRDKLKPWVKPEVLAFLQSKIAGHEQTPIKITKVGTDKYSVEAMKFMTKLEFTKVTYDGKVDFTVNARKILYTPKMTINELWEKVAAALPKESAGLMDLMIPKAEAEAMAIVAYLVVLVVGAILVAGYAVVKKVLEMKDADSAIKLDDICTAQLAARDEVCDPNLKMNAEQLFAEARFDKTRSAVFDNATLNTRQCSKVDRFAVQRCLNDSYSRLISELNRTVKVPADLADYFGVKDQDAILPEAPVAR